jgi:hypothetical protein
MVGTVLNFTEDSDLKHFQNTGLFLHSLSPYIFLITLSNDNTGINNVITEIKKFTIRRRLKTVLYSSNQQHSTWAPSHSTEYIFIGVNNKIRG